MSDQRGWTRETLAAAGWTVAAILIYALGYTAFFLIPGLAVRTPLTHLPGWLLTGAMWVWLAFGYLAMPFVLVIVTLRVPLLNRSMVWVLCASAVFTLAAVRFPIVGKYGLKAFGGSWTLASVAVFLLWKRWRSRNDRRSSIVEPARPADGVGFEQHGNGALHR